MPATVVAEVKAILYHGPGAARDLRSFDPVDPTDFGCAVQILIGETGNDLFDSFDLIVCSPSWLAGEVAGGRWFEAGPTGMSDDVAVGSRFWFMRRWERGEFESAVRFLCETYSPAPDWGSVAARIGRLIPWEFDYRYDGHVDSHFGSPFPPPRDP